MSTQINDRFQDILIAEYWQKKLSAAVPVPVSNRDVAGTGVASLQLDEALTQKIKTLCQGNSLAEFTYLLSFYLLLLQKYNGQPVTVATGDVRYGEGAARKDHLLFFSAGAYGTLNVKEWVGEVKKDLVDVLRHRAFDYTTLSADLQNKNIKTSELTQFSFAYGKLNESSVPLALSKLSLRIEETGTAFSLALSFDNNIYPEAMADQLLASYACLLQQAVSDPTAAVGGLSLLSQEARLAQLSRTGSVTPAQWEDKTIVDVFEEKAALYPDEIALVSGGNKWTYQQLNEKCNQLAHYFKTAYDLKPEEPVGLMVHSNEWLVVGMLSILKAGGCFVPVEAGLPVQRKAHIFSDAAIRTIITEFDLMTSAGSFSGNLFFIDFQADTLDTSTENPGFAVQPGNVAYIIYTSGTTGLPKGVMIEHRSLVNYADWFIHQFSIGANDSALLTSSYAFDLGYTNIWGALLSGAELHLVDLDLKRSAVEILNYLVDKKISFIKTTPSFFYMLLHQPQFEKLAPQLQVRLILLGGEPLHIDDVLHYWDLHPDTTMVNHYGPTETTIGSVFHVLSKENVDDYRRATVIGNEVVASQAYVLDEASNLLPPGVAGELGLSGAGVARGYLNQPALTFDKFVSHPFVEGARLYRTGDIAKRNINNNTITLSGRRDSQVKIRGYRVELGEIAVAMKRHTAISQAIAIVRQDEQGNPSLVAYYSGDNSLEFAQLKSFLNDYLPEYMIPAQAIFLNTFPITANGKVDVKALPEPKAATNSNYEAPVTPEQKQLAELWQQVLGVKQVGLKDQFFDIGGHSLKATQLLTEIHRQMNARIGLNDIFDFPVLRDMADLIARTEKGEEPSMVFAGEQDYYALSFAQRRLWLIQQFDEGGGAYNVHNSFPVTGLQPESFDRAIQALLVRHEIMRTSFEVVDGEPQQKIHTADAFPLPVKYIDLRTESDQAAAIAAIVREEKARGFNLSEAPLFRVAVLQLSDTDYQVEMNIHHIIHDGWSKGVLLRDFTALYEHFTEGAPALPELKVQYKDYVATQQASLEQGQWEEHRSYWHSQFADGAPVLELPTEGPRPLMKQYKGAGITFLLGEENIKALTGLCQQQNATLFMGLLAMVKLLLHRYTGQQDLVIGTPMAGRDRAELKDQLGFYINTLAIRTQPDVSKGFSELLKQVRDTTVNAYAHQEYPFDLLVDELKISRDMSRTPVFDVMVLLQNIGDPLVFDADAVGKVDGQLTQDENSKFDLTFTFQETDKGVLAHLTYSIDLYSEARMRGMVQHLKNLLQSVKEDAVRPLSSLSYLDTDERNELLKGFAGEEVGYDEQRTIISLFEQRAAEYPSRTAITNGASGITYRELNEKANQVAHYLLNNEGLQRDTLVGLMASRSEWTITAMLGILKAGGAYVPIDPEYPTERKEYILNDSNIQFLLSEESTAAAWIDTANEIKIITAQDVKDQSKENPSVVSTPDNLAYVIYTSGSSGKPKGVLIEHYNVVRLLFNEANRFDFAETDVWSLFHSMCFDFSVWEIYGALLYGGRLVIVPSETAKDPAAFTSLIQNEGVTVLNQVPGVFNLVSAQVLSAAKKPALNLRYVIFGGEALNPASLQAWRRQYPDVRLINMYGITETTVHTTYKEITEAQIESGESNIGVAIPTVSLYLTDSEGDLAARGLVGELLVGGKGLARGYLNRPELTSERFIPNPWNAGRLYRSGDLARQLPSGEFVYLGRSDFQVKIRGHRIELGEIEDTLLRYEGVGAAVVTAKGKGTEAYLVAYYTGGKADVSALRSWLLLHLPAYMVPSVFVHLENGFVLTSNGKVDRRQLPDPHQEAAAYVAPETACEKQLAAIWEKTLNLEKLSVTADFFESGGNSISAARLVGYIGKELRIRISLRAIFDAPSVRQLARVIEDLQQTTKDEDLILPQKYTWMLDSIEGPAPARNVYASLDTEEHLEAERLQQAATRLQERNELLRAQVVVTGGVPKQRITGNYTSVECIDLRGLIAPAAEAQLTASLEQPFTIEESPLFRILLVQYNNSQKLVLLAHSILLDAPSARYLLNELLTLYREPLALNDPAPHSSVAKTWNDYLQQNKLSPENLTSWTNLREQGIPQITFYGDQQTQAQGYDKGTYTTGFGAATTQELQRLGASAQATLFDVLVTGLNILIHRYTGLQEFVLATPITADTWKRNSALPIGPFEYQLPIFQQLADGDSLNDLLSRTAQQLARAKAQAYPFEEWMAQHGDTQNWNFDITVSLDEQEPTDFISSGGAGNLTNLIFHFYQKDQQLWLRLEYNKKIFSGDRVSLLASRLQMVLASFAANGNRLVDEMDFLTSEEAAALTNQQITTEQPLGAHLVDVFAQHAAATPNAVAAFFKEGSMSYRELDKRSDGLAAYLTHEKGVQNGVLIGVFLERSFSSLVTLLGILKAGGAYLPIDTAYPPQRVKDLMQDSGAHLLLSDPTMESQLQLLKTDEPWEIVSIAEALAYSNVVYSATITPEQLAYCLYTSGSKGKPKGVLIEHSQLIHTLHAEKLFHGLNAQMIGCASTNYTFDVSLLELLLPLYVGGSVVIPEDEQLQDEDYFIRLLSARSVTDLQGTPTFISSSLIQPLIHQELPVELPQLKRIWIGGESLNEGLINNLRNYLPDVQVNNHYGLTETTIDCIAKKEVKGFKRNSVGHPLAYSKVYILDKDLNLLPQGAIGEICIGGRTIARGYLHNEELNREKFIADPYSPEGRIYRTGDFGYFSEEGEVVYIGRRDRQLKIRGHRIESGEVEQVLLRHPGVRQGIVMAQPNGAGELELVAYVIAEESATDRLQEYGNSLEAAVRNFLRQQLPSYMIPSMIVETEYFPLTSSGKVDHKALQQLRLAEKPAAKVFVAAENDSEKTISAIWCEVLNLDQVSVIDNFFDLGGHSIRAARVAALIDRELGIRVSLKAIYDQPTVRGLATLIRETGPAGTGNIVAVEEQEHYPVSHAQKRMWILDQVEREGISAYNMPFVWEMEGLDLGLVQESFDRLMQRHESLRTSFVTVEGAPRQRVWPVSEAGFRVQYIDLREDPEKATTARRLVDAENNKPFDLERGPLLRSCIVQMEDNRQLFLLTLQHTVGDAWSMELFKSDFKTIYNALLNGSEPALAPLAIQYKDYAVWQHRMLEEGRVQKEADYWMAQFSTEPPVLELAGDKPRPVIKTYNGGIISTTLDASYSRRLYELSQELQASITMILMASVKALLYKYSGHDDITVGCPIIGRDTVELEHQIGFYVNTLAIRTSFNPELGFKELVYKVRENILNAFDHQLYPFDKLVEDLDLHRDLSRSPLFDVMVVHHNVDTGSRQSDMEGVEIGKFVKTVQQSKFDLTFNFADSDEGLKFSINYNSDIYTENRIKEVAAHFETLLSSALSATEAPVHTLGYLTPAETEKLVYRFNDSLTPYPKGRMIHEIIEEQAARIPDSTALICEDRHISFREMNERANRLAHYLRTQYDVKGDDLFGVMLGRTEWIPIALLAVLKAGGAYVPLDPNYPKARNRSILEDAGVKALITERSIFTASELDYPGLNTVIVDEAGEELANYPATDPLRVGGPGDLFYIIYTSGSTGKPKGVAISHHNIASFLGWAWKEYGEARFDLVYFSTSTCFDMSVFEIFVTLTMGKPLRVMSSGMEIDRWLQQDKEVLVNTVPSVVQNLLALGTDLSNVRVLNMAGEPIPYAIKERLENEDMKMVNIYGPSEYTGGTSFYRLTKESRKILIGEPMSNSHVFILDNYLHLVPVGVKGEIYVSGENISRGYLNRPQLTAEKYIAHPFEPGNLLYKTGDIGQWDEDGNIELFGRSDNQVKIRGYRIELGEIEAILDQHPGVKQSIVDVRMMPSGQNYLVAYYTGTDTELSVLRSYIGKLLPAHMVPSYIIHLPSFQLTPNGKVDRKKLPVPNENGEGIFSNYVAPVNETERKLAGIWADVLKKEKVGRTDNFFELGGHSLKATQVMVKVHRVFDAQITLNSIFEKPELKDLARHIQACGRSVYESVPVVEEQEYYPISHAQRRLWVLEQFSEARGAYNIFYSLEFADLDLPAFTAALCDLVQRHEILRTVFRQVNGETCQIVRPSVPEELMLSFIDLRGRNDQEAEILRHRAIDDRHVFDFENGPLLMVKVLQLEGNGCLVLINMHHIIFDGWSKLVLEREFSELYDAHMEGREANLPALAIQYRDYACWQKGMLDNGGWDEHREYWHRQLANLPVLELPSDYQRPSYRTYEGLHTSFSLGLEWSEKLTKFCEKEGVTLFMVMLSASNALFYKYTGQDDMVIGTPVSNRDRVELEDQLGFYVNTLALRSTFNGAQNFSELLQEVKKTILDASTHQQYPFDVLVDELDFGHSINRAPLFDVMIDVQNFGERSTGKRVTLYDEAFKFSPILVKSDLSFTFAESQQGIIVDVNSAASLFTPQRIERMMRHFVNLLHNVLQEPSQPLSKLDYMSQFEQQRILREFNRAEVNTPPARNLMQLFEAQAALQPAHVVMRSAVKDYSYQQLNEQSNRVAHLLLNKYHTKKGDFVGVIMKPGELMIITLLGIVKAGCAYVPIDVVYPEERAAHIITDAGMKVIIAEREVPVNIPSTYEYEVVQLSLDETLFSSLPIHNPQREDGVDDLFSLLYTSGSTGIPKGVFIRNKGLVNRIDWLWHRYSFGSSDVVYFKTPFVFDVSIGEIFMPLCYGAQLFIADSNTTDEICQNAAANRVSYLHFSPTALNNFLDLVTPEQVSRFTSLRYVLCSGEALLTEIVNKYYAKMDTPLLNLYGPTEASIEVSCYETKRGDEIIPIGKPIANVKLYVLDKNLELLPVGVPGEICIAGVALSTGYLNQEEKTAERFLPDPHGEPGARLYKTGDVGRWNDKGEVEFLGRRDNQININGTRIELEEIESALLTYNEVVETAITYRKTENEHYHLIAYYVRRKEEAAEEEVTETLLTGEQAAFIDAINDTQVDYEGSKLVHRLFESAAEEFAGSVAIVCDNRITTYEALNKKANQLARLIRDRFAPGTMQPVAVLMDRSEDMIAALLAVLKLQLTYVPLDTDYPRDRIQSILDDAQPSLLITNKTGVPYEGVTELDWSQYVEILEGYEGGNLPRNENVQPAYIMYTSGSTGRPKGVIVGHDAVTDYIQTFTQYFSLSSSDVVLQQASAAFDTFVEETFPALCSGAQLVVLPSGGRDIDALIKAAIDRRATLLSTTPLVINEINTHPGRTRLSLRALISGGDTLKPSYIDALIGKVRIFNTYGPTEATVCATFSEVETTDECAVIGRPIANHRVYILNDSMEAQGIGVTGELFIGGAGLAQGYLNREEETAKAFIGDPFNAGQRLYRTGDTGRWLQDGRIEFTGRRDRQVKIRGYRIEAAEVEAAIAGVEGIGQVHVISRDDSSGNKNLVAYFTSPDAVSNEQLRQQLNGKMPAYMVPAHLVQVDKFPLTHNGKIDYRALPMPAALATDYQFISELKEHLKKKLPFYMVPGMYVEMEKLPLTATGKIDRNGLKKISELADAESVFLEPRTEMEKKLAAIWESVLKRERVGLSDNLFEMGGNSIKATQIVSRIAHELNVQVPLGEFFNDPTVEGLAALVRRTSTTTYDHLTTNNIMAQQHYPVSFAQRRLWVIEQFEEAKDAGAYNMPSHFDFDQLDAAAFNAAVDALIDRHEILRTTFEMAAGEAVQKIWDREEFGFRVNYTDLRAEENPVQKARQLIQEDAYRPFDLVTGPLLRIFVLQLSDNSWKVCFNQHHIISDGWSMDVVARDFNELYESILEGRPSTLAPLPLQYKDYTLWQKGQLESGQWEEYRSYWHGQLDGELPVMEIPSDFPRPMHKRYEGAQVRFTLNRNESQMLQQLCRDNGSTMFMCFVAMTKILLYRYTGQSDIITGFPIAGRDRVELEDQLGFYVNTLALRTRFSGNDSFLDVLNKVKEVTLGAYRHQQYPFDLLVDELGLERDMSRTPLFDVMVMAQSHDGAIPYEDGISHKEGGVSKFDMTFSFTESSGSTEVSIVYSVHQFSEARMKRMALHLKQLIRSAAEEPDASVKTIEYLSSKEKSQFIYDFNGGRKPFPSNTLHGLFEEQAAITPDAIAVKYNNQYLTYESLNEYANQFATHLKQHFGVQKQGIVGVMVSRTHLLPVVMMGILKAGAAYVPLDPEYPEARLRFMLEDTSAQAVVTDNTVLANPALAALIRDFNVINFDEEFSALGHYPSANVSSDTTETDLAYLIYTSGTTGRPKGVCLSHRNGVALVNWAKGEFADSVFETVFATTSYCFDLSVYEIFYTLSSGKQLRILQNALELKKWVYREQNILVNTVPSVVQDLLQQEVDLRSVSVLNIAGEPVPSSVVNGLNLEQIEVRNLYGPSEYATYSTCYRFLPGDTKILIGKPLPNTQVYILDDEQNLLPVGVKGELYVSGDHLSRGYLNRPDLTAEKFIAHPFDTGKKLYRTGDIGIREEDGNINCFGRKDNQVKLRGFRIELGEIESILGQFEEVEAAIVMIRETADGDRFLVGYYSGKPAAAEDIKQHLSGRLPHYMIPDRLLHMEAFPLSPNGKIDRKRLPDLDVAAVRQVIVEAATAGEERLLRIWKEVLRRDNFGVTDNFFEIGGQSLKAMQIISRINTELGASINIKEIFNQATVRKLAAFLEQDKPKESLLVYLSQTEVLGPSALLIPPILGSSTIYRSLAKKLEGKINCYGLQYKGSGNNLEYDNSIEAMAESFGAEIEKMKLQDVVLVGYSMGALIAFELAKLLEQKKVRVRLVLLDRTLRRDATEDDIRNASEEMIDRVFALEFKSWLMHADQASINAFRRIFRHNLALITRYEPSGRVNGSITVVEATQNKKPTNMYEWESFAGGGFQHLTVDAVHAELLNDTGIATISKVIAGAQQELVGLA